MFQTLYCLGAEVTLLTALNIRLRSDYCLLTEIPRRPIAGQPPTTGSWPPLFSHSPSIILQMDPDWVGLSFLQFICHGQLANISKATLAQNQSLIHTQGRITSLVSRLASSLSSNQNIFSHLQNSFLLPKPNSKQNSSPSQSKTSYSLSHLLHSYNPPPPHVALRALSQKRSC